MLTPEQVAQYHEEGHTLAPEVLTRPEVDALLAEVETLTASASVENHDSTRLEMKPNQGPEGEKVRRLHEPCTYYPPFRALSEKPELLDGLERLIGPNLSPKPRTTLLMAYRAEDAFPIHLSKRTAAHEPHERLVRGQESSMARFAQGSFPIPRYPIETNSTSSLYDLQARYRKEQAADPLWIRH